MKKTFIINLPVDEEDLIKGELFIDDITELDLKNKKTESTKINTEQIFSDFIYIEKEIKLKEFLPEVLQHLLRKSILSFNYSSSFFIKEKRRLNFLNFEHFPNLKIAYQTEIVTPDISNSFFFNDYIRIDVVKENIEYFKSFGDKLNKLLLSNLEISDLENWVSDYKGKKTEIIVTLYAKSAYELADNFIFTHTEEILKNYLVYFYKNLILFKKKWKSQSLDQIIKKTNVKSTDLKFFNRENSLMLSQPIKNFKQFKTLTNFYSTQEVFKRINLINDKTKMMKIIKEGDILKRGEGPFDFNWNKRYLVLQTDFLFYFEKKDTKETKGEIFLKNCVFGNIEQFDGQDYAFCLHFIEKNKFVWFAHSEEAVVKEWRQKMIETQIKYVKLEVIKETKEKEINKSNLQIFSESDKESENSVYSLLETTENKEWEFYKVSNLTKLFYMKDDEIKLVKKSFFTNFLKKNIKSLLISILLSTFYYFFIMKESLSTIALTIVLILGFNMLIVKKESESIILKAEITIKKKQETIVNYITNLFNIEKWNNNFENLYYFSTQNEFKASLFSQKFIVKGKLRQYDNHIYFEITNSNADFLLQEVITISENISKDSTKLVSLIKINSKKHLFFDLFLKAEKYLATLSRLRDILLLDLKTNLKEKKKEILLNNSQNSYLKGEPFLENKLNLFEEEKKDILALKKTKRIHLENNIQSLSVRKINKFILEPNKRYHKLGLLIMTQFLEDIFLRNLNLCNIIFPIKMMCKKSIFDYICDLLKPSCLYLSLAIENNDDLEKLKNVLSFVVAGLSEIEYWKKIPFIPFKGETAQFIWDDYTTADFEMISDNQFSFLLFNKLKGFAISASPSLFVKINNNSFEINIKGKFKVYLKNKENKNELIKTENEIDKIVNDFNLANLLKSKNCIFFEYPKIIVENIHTENIFFSFKDKIKISYPNLNLIGEIDFIATSQKKEKMKKGHFIGDVKNEENITVFPVFCKWPDFLNLNDVCYWDNFIKPPPYTRVNRLLHSDVSIRDDIYNFKMKQYKRAEETLLIKKISQRTLDLIRKNFNLK